MTKPIPVPPGSRSPKGAGGAQGSKEKVSREDAKRANRADNLKQQGEAGNIEQNTRHQGYQQDR
ncbi:MAG: hypothetical protein LCH93_27885 [Proteobacteria bacterium]|nr:hypothetical protein [Pseudomonadota bacterium]